MAGDEAVGPPGSRAFSCPAAKRLKHKKESKQIEQKNVRITNSE